MLDQTLDCLVSGGDGSGDWRPLLTVRPGGLETPSDHITDSQRAYLRDAGFGAQENEICLLPGEDRVSGAVLGLGAGAVGPQAFGTLATALPEGMTWRLLPGDYDPGDAVLGFCLGAYHYKEYKPPARKPARMLITGPFDRQRAEAAAIWMVRDLINAPANVLGPGELAAVALQLAGRFGTVAEIVSGDELGRQFPAIAAVGAGSARAPQVVTFRWQGSAAVAESPLLSLCGKGICFDTGGYDVKPSAGMLRMKKDMAGAAVVLGIARLVMSMDLPLRLVVRVACAENSISGTAMRPLDVIRTRHGLSVEIGNTDAEGRLVLCDLLADASAEKPALLVDCATLTGAARVALGPDLPALFCNDDEWAELIVRAGSRVHDPLWRLPLFAGYRDWLKSPTADLNTVSSKPHAGAIVAALFLSRFVDDNVPWAHIDLFGWNEQHRPGKPEGGEAQALRAVFAAVRDSLSKSADSNSFAPSVYTEI